VGLKVSRRLLQIGFVVEQEIELDSVGVDLGVGVGPLQTLLLEKH
jgi:hypothetical protein